VGYHFADYLHKKIPPSWENNGLAGEDWLKGFRHTSHHFFIGKIISAPDEEGNCDVKFLQRFRKIKNGFTFPEKEDIASVSRNGMN